MAEAGKTKMNERMNKKETVVTTKSVNLNMFPTQIQTSWIIVNP